MTEIFSIHHDVDVPKSYGLSAVRLDKIYPDIFGQFGWINFNDISRRQKVVSILA